MIRVEKKEKSKERVQQVENRNLQLLKIQIYSDQCHTQLTIGASIALVIFSLISIFYALFYESMITLNIPFVLAGWTGITCMLREMLSYQLLSHSSKHFDGSSVDIENSPRPIQIHERVIGILEYAPELLLAFPQRFLSPLDLGAFDKLPLTFPFNDSKLMVANHVNNFGCPAFVKRIGADGYHLIFADDVVYLLFIIYKISPISFFKPSRITCYSYAIITLSQGLIEFFNSAIQDPL